MPRLHERTEGALDRKEAKQIGIRLEEAIIKLIREKPVFGFILTRMRRVQAPHLVPTMGIRPTADRYIQLVYNPLFVDILTEDQLIAVLEHEVMHVLNEHPMRRGGREPQKWNIAADMAINQYIEGLPPDCIPVLEGLEKERETEYYYGTEEVEQYTEKLQQCRNDCPVHGDGKGGGSGDDEEEGEGKEEGQAGQGGDQDSKDGDQSEGGGAGGGGDEKRCTCGDSMRGDHSGWDDLDGDVSAQEKIRQMIRGAVEDAKQQGRGTMPGWMEEMIQRILQPPIRWNIRLRSGISEEITPQPEETFRRPHRRRMFDVNGVLEDVFPGFKHKPQSELTVAIDTSGSMGARELGEILNELAHLRRSGYDPIEIIHCDTQITKIERYNGKNEIVCHGRGGTCFRPVLDYLRDEKPIKEGFKPTLIYFTDGFGENPSDDGYTKRFKTLWVISREGSTSNVAQFGTIIKMEKNRRA